MLKRIGCSIFTVILSSLTYAGNYYLSPTIFLERVAGSQTNYTNLRPELALGYSAMPHSLYMAGEVFIVPFAADISDNHNLTTFTAKDSLSLGASFLPGFMMYDSVLMYARLGAVLTRFNSPHVFTTGAQIGLGVQPKLIDNWSMRVEYDFTMYRKLAGMGSPKSNQLGLGLVYKFDNTNANEG